MKAFLFDFDGVIVDSERYWDTILDQRLGEIIPSWNPETLDRMMGLSAHGAHALLSREYGLKLSVDEYLAMIDETIRNMYLTKTELMPGFLDLLGRLEALPVPIGIASSSQGPWIHACLDRFGLTKRFASVATGDEVPGRAKPLPDVYLLAAKRLNADPAECVAIEDSRNGIAAAKAAGMTCIGLRSDLNAHQDLSAADMVVTDMAAIDVKALGNRSHE